MAKIIVITKCNECPYVAFMAGADGKKIYVGCVVNQRTFDWGEMWSSGQKIPGWCPLPSIDHQQGLDMGFPTKIQSKIF
jgi:hypothetical protein